MMRNIAPKLYQRARDSLAADIANGAIPTTKRLTESWVAELFGISRVPARQALAELEQRGLIRKAEGRGYAIAEEAANRSRQSGSSNGDPLVRKSADSRMQFMPSWQLIYTEIESEIFARTSLADWRVNALALAKHYGVSRTVAQDVMARLQQRGVIQKDERGRWFAPALTDKHIHDLFELRWVLEPLALEKALPRLPEGFLARVRRNLDEAVTAPLVAGETLDRLEQELHVELLGHCDSASLLEAVRLPQTLLVAHHFLYQWTSGLFASEPFLPEHLEIVMCLQSDNLAGAQRALVNHLQISHERAMLRINTLASTIRPRELPYLERQS
ncbi:GntR family transcriptional regulator [Ochrobactrum soli]|uniref:GntR family transcriptional regulator n=1 Tax=Ochrobactrum soli TaxID=2448455 RepID=A0A849KGA4_9HYPH|nr:GntR family transcriptional regulator [[Ochrobactrum] soli]NNU60551.1 GntR family transcriptional regulator [[Ochrobactrum] soli]